MGRNLLWLTLLVGLLMQGCVKETNQEVPVSKHVNLSKAAAYNVQLGLAYLKQGHRTRAKKKLLMAQQQAPRSADVNAALAYYFEQSNEMVPAKQYYLKAVALSGNAGAQLNNYGAFLCRHGDYKEAEMYFLRAVKDINYLHTAKAYENAGLCSLARQDYNGAVQYFKKALNHDPSRRGALYEWVKIENNRDDTTAALAALQRYPGLVSKDPVFLTLAQQVAQKAGNEILSRRYKIALQNIAE